MSVRASVEVEVGVVVVRQRADARDAAGLQRRSEALAVAAGPGVVRIVRTGPTGVGGWELVTEHGGLPLDVARVDGPTRLAAIVGAAADTLAQLHARGLVHGRLEVQHVLVGPGGAPALCGFGPGPGSPADDVAALGRILVEASGHLPEPRVTRRGQLAALLALADLATATDADRRPSARRLSADLAALAAAASPATTEARRARLAAVGAAGIAIVAAFGLIGAGSQDGGADPGAGPAPTAPAPSTSTTRPPPPVCVATARHVVVVAGGQCPQAVSVDEEAVIVDGRRIVVGRPGDEVVVGDWGCEGGVRPVVLRPTTGEVLVYGPLEGAEGPVIALAERVDGALGLATELDDQGCAALLVITEAGAIRLT